jgi:Ca2+-transporting ATPase
VTRPSSLLTLVVAGFCWNEGALSSALGLVVLATATALLLALIDGGLRQAGAPRGAGDTALLRRRGHLLERPVGEIVLGDLVRLEPGRAVPADLRLVDALNLSVDESALTGHLEPAAKDVRPLPEEAPVSDRRNMAFQGGVVYSGVGWGTAVAVGSQTEFSRACQREEDDRRWSSEGRAGALSGIAVAGAILGSVVGRVGGGSISAEWIAAVCLAVCPVHFPAVRRIVQVAAAIAARRRGLWVRRPGVLDRVGAVDVLVLDETVLVDDRRSRLDVAFCDGRFSGRLGTTPPWRHFRRALQRSGVASDDVRPDETRAASPVAELAWDASRRRRTTFHRESGGYDAVTIGSAEGVLARCVTMQTAAGPKPLNRLVVGGAVERLASKGLRVQAVAQRRWPALPIRRVPEAVESDLVFLGLIGVRSMVRAEARRAIVAARAAGIRVLLVSTEERDVVRSLARAMGFPEEGRLMTGLDLESHSDESLRAEAERTSIYAAVSRAQKARLLEALRGADHCVGAVVSRVEDIESLRRADVSFASEAHRSDAVRRAADVRTAGNSFFDLWKAIREGRRWRENGVRAAGELAAVHTAWGILLLASPWIGSTTVGSPGDVFRWLWLGGLLPAGALLLEPSERRSMRRPSRPPAEIMSAREWARGMIDGSLLALFSFAAWGAVLAFDGEMASGRIAAAGVVGFGALARTFFERTEVSTPWGIRHAAGGAAALSIATAFFSSADVSGLAAVATLLATTVLCVIFAIARRFR